MPAQFVFTGRSGATYIFDLLDARRCLKAWPGLYAFIRLNLFAETRLLYIGESFCMGTRLSHHERWREAVKKGANHIAVRHSPRTDLRLDEERDLIKGNNPPLNRVHRLTLADVSPKAAKLRAEINAARAYE